MTPEFDDKAHIFIKLLQVRLKLPTGRMQRNLRFDLFDTFEHHKF